MSLVVKMMRSGQEDVVAVLIRSLPRDIGLDVTPKITGQSLRAAKGLAEVTVAEDAGLILGVCLWCMTFSSWRGSAGIYISDLYILPHMRGKKIGEKLLRGTLREAAKRGATFVKMEVDISNMGAQRFYEKLGFKHKEDDRFYTLEKNGFEELSG